MTFVEPDDALDELRDGLRDLRDRAGRPTFRALEAQADQAGISLPSTTAHELVSGRRLPRWSTVSAFVLTIERVARAHRPPLMLPAQLTDLTYWRQLYDRIEQPTRARPVPTSTSSAPAPTGFVPPPEIWSRFVEAILALDAAHAALRAVAIRGLRPNWPQWTDTKD